MITICMILASVYVSFGVAIAIGFLRQLNRAWRGESFILKFICDWGWLMTIVIVFGWLPLELYIMYVNKPD